MRSVQRAICVSAMGVAAAIGVAGAAQAASATFYVNVAGGNDLNACTVASAPCKTITAAIAKAEAEPEAETVTIQVAAGVYKELVALKKAAASGITINGVGSGVGGTEIEGPEKVSEPTVELGVLGGTLALSNLSVVNDQKEDTGRGIRATARATLTNVVVTMAQTVNADGIEAESIGAVTIHGGGVTMAAGTEGFAIAGAGPLSIDGASVLVAGGSLAGGIASELFPISVTNTVVDIASAVSEEPAIVSGVGSGFLSGDTVIQNGAGASASGIQALLPAPLSVHGVKVTMSNPASKAAAVVQDLGTATYQGLTVGGSWQGSGFLNGAEGGNATLADSRITAGPGSLAPAMVYIGGSEGPGLVLERSVLQANPTASPAALYAANANATIDSSEVLGAQNAVVLEQKGGKTRTLTVAGSTIDAGNLGVADGGSVTDLLPHGGTGQQHRQRRGRGLDPAGAAGRLHSAWQPRATSLCSNSDVPSQIQAETGAEGQIACGAGSAGNTHSEPAALFAAPIADYQLSPSSQRDRQRARRRDLAARSGSRPRPPTSRATRAWWTATATASPSRTGARWSCRGTPRPAPAPLAPGARAILRRDRWPASSPR